MAGRKRLDVSQGKTCPRCKEHKPPTEFHKSAYTVHGLQVYCKACQYAKHSDWRQDHKPYCAKASKKWRDANPELAREYKRRAVYAIPFGTYERLLAEQEGHCAICLTMEPGGKGGFHIDHCHSTGTIRGLLCQNCNLLLGHAKDDPAVFHSAISYLAKSR